MKKIRLVHLERNKEQNRDKCHRNSRPTKQETLVNMADWALRKRKEPIE